MSRRCQQPPRASGCKSKPTCESADEQAAVPLATKAESATARQEMSTKLLSLEMSARPLSPSRALKTRDGHEATFST